MFRSAVVVAAFVLAPVHAAGQMFVLHDGSSTLAAIGATAADVLQPAT